MAESKVYLKFYKGNKPICFLGVEEKEQGPYGVFSIRGFPLALSVNSPILIPFKIEQNGTVGVVRAQIIEYELLNNVGVIVHARISSNQLVEPSLHHTDFVKIHDTNIYVFKDEIYLPSWEE